MAQPITQHGETQELREDQWGWFLAEFTKENRGAHGRIDVLGGEVGRQVETENRPFDGVSADMKDGEHTVWIMFGSMPSDHLAHGVENVVAIRVRPPVGEMGSAMEVEAHDGIKTILTLSRPDAYALPEHGR
jgi:hypothetical protein